MIALTTFQAIVFIGYVLFIYSQFGVLQSISDSWYKLKEKGGVWYSLFTWFTWLIGIPLFFQTNGSSPFFFIAGAGLTFVGVATMFKLSNSIEPYIHFAGAVIGITASFIALVVERGVWLPAVVFVITALCIQLLYKKNTTWWIEIAAFVCIILALY
jgi:hypothetical protein